jgi:hypothetical protein
MTLSAHPSLFEEPQTALDEGRRIVRLVYGTRPCPPSEWRLERSGGSRFTGIDLDGRVGWAKAPGLDFATQAHAEHVARELKLKARAVKD